MIGLRRWYRGAWWTTVYRVAKSETRLSVWTHRRWNRGRPESLRCGQGLWLLVWGSCVLGEPALLWDSSVRMFSLRSPHRCVQMSPHGPTALQGAVQAGGHGHPTRQVFRGSRPAAMSPVSSFKMATCLMLQLLLWYGLQSLPFPSPSLRPGFGGGMVTRPWVRRGLAERHWVLESSRPEFGSSALVSGWPGLSYLAPLGFGFLSSCSGGWPVPQQLGVTRELVRDAGACALLRPAESASALYQDSQEPSGRPAPENWEERGCWRDHASFLGCSVSTKLPRHLSRTSPKLTAHYRAWPAPGILMQTCCQDVPLSSNVSVVVLNPQEGLFLFL